MPTTPYNKTSLPSEAPSEIANWPASDINRHFNRPLRSLMEIWACINGTDAGNDVDGNPLENYTGIGITDRIENLEGGTGLRKSTSIDLAYSVLAAGDRFLKMFQNSTTVWKGFKWDNAAGLFKVIDNAGVLLKIQAALPTAADDLTTKTYVDTRFPKGYQGSAPLVYVNGTTASMAYIRERSKDDTVDIRKETSTTVDIATVGVLNGILQTANLTGTLAYNNASASVTGTSTLFTTELQIGDTIYDQTNGVAVGTVLSIASNTALTLTRNFSGTNRTGASYRAGCRAPDAVYYVYADTDGTTPGLFLSNRSVVNGDSIPVTFPSGYGTAKMRQIGTALVTGSASTLINYTNVGGNSYGWQIKYNVASTHWNGSGYTVGTCNILNAGSATSYTDIGPGIVRQFIPKIAGTANLCYTASNSAAYANIRVDGESHTGIQTSGSSPDYIDVIVTPATTYEYQRTAGSGNIYYDVMGWTSVAKM